MLYTEDFSMCPYVGFSQIGSQLLFRHLIFNYACYQALVNDLLSQRSSCIGGLQVEKCVILFVQA